MRVCVRVCNLDFVWVPRLSHPNWGKSIANLNVSLHSEVHLALERVKQATCAADLHKSDEVQLTDQCLAYAQPADRIAFC